MAKEEATESRGGGKPKPTAEQLNKLITDGTTKALDGALQAAQLAAHGGIITADQAKADVVNAVKAWAAAH